MTTVSYCPFCGEEIERPTTATTTDSRISAGYRCRNCDRVLKLRVESYPNPAAADR